MSNEVTETKVVSQTRKPQIKASCELWDRFDEWKRVQGCQTDPEGFRVAMKQVTNFNGEVQQKTT